MNEQTFLSDLERVMQLEPGSLRLTDPLATLGKWDSLAVVGFIALADSKYGVGIVPDRLRECVTIGDLLKLVTPA